MTRRRRTFTIQRTHKTWKALWLLGWAIGILGGFFACLLGGDPSVPIGLAILIVYSSKALAWWHHG